MKTLNKMGQNPKSDSQSSEEIHASSEFGNVICTCPSCGRFNMVYCLNCLQSNELVLASNEQGGCIQCSCGFDTNATTCECGCQILGSFFEYVDIDRLFKKAHSLKVEYIQKKLSKAERKTFEQILETIRDYSDISENKEYWKLQKATRVWHGSIFEKVVVLLILLALYGIYNGGVWILNKF